MGNNDYYRKLLELLTGMSSEDYARYLLKCVEEEGHLQKETEGASL